MEATAPASGRAGVRPGWPMPELSEIHTDVFQADRLFVVDLLEDLASERQRLSAERDRLLAARAEALRDRISAGEADVTDVNALLDAITTDLARRTHDRRAEALGRAFATSDLRQALSLQERMQALLGEAQEEPGPDDPVVLLRDPLIDQAVATEPEPVHEPGPAAHSAVLHGPMSGPAVHDPGAAVPESGSATRWAAESGADQAVGVMSPEPVLVEDPYTDLAGSSGGAAAGNLDNETRVLLLTLAHDLRTPLSAIVGFAELLGERIDELTYDKIQMFAGQLLGGARQVQVVLDNLLDAERMSTGLSTLVGTRTDIGLQARLLVDRLHPIDHTVLVEPEHHEAVVDHGVIERILENLVLNAVRHTPAGTKVRVGVDQWQDDVYLSVTDDGPGIPPGDVEGLFDAFHGASDAGGLGLGLHLVRELARLHGGDVRVESTPGRGTQFVVHVHTLSETRAAGQGGENPDHPQRPVG